MKERLLAGVYRMEESLDDQGALEVWRAVDQRRRRTVAIRIPKADAADETRDAFAAELDASERLRDRCLVRALCTGTDNGVPFLVTEFAEGRSLEDMLADGEQPVQRAVGITAGLCRLVARARRAGVAHVALEPRHLIVGPAGVKVTRFGPRAGRSFLRLETTRCTAPEQDTAVVETEAEDVYNLGVILQALIGTGPEDHEAGEGGMLEAIARRATAEAPEDRYAGIAEMLDALRAYGERSRIRRQLRPAVALAAIAVAIGILATWFAGTAVTVPRVVGMPPPAAAASLRRAMLVPETVATGGAAVSVQYPAAGTRVRPRSAVRLLTSTTGRR